MKIYIVIDKPSRFTDTFLHGEMGEVDKCFLDRNKAITYCEKEAETHNKNQNIAFPTTYTRISETTWITSSDNCMEIQEHDVEE